MTTPTKSTTRATPVPTDEIDSARDGDGQLRPSNLVSRGEAGGTTTPAQMPLHGWMAAVRAFRHRDYRLLWSAALVSNIGTWMQTMAEAWLVYDLSKSTLWLGIDSAASDIPVAVLLLLGGVLADRLDRRRLLIATNAFSGLLAAVLAVLVATGVVRVWMIVLMSFLVGVSDAIRIPATQSLVPALVGRSDVPNAVALNSIQFNASRVIGPTIGGLALVGLGVAWSFGLNAVSFIAVIAAMVLIHYRPLRVQHRESLGESFAAGLRYVRGRRDMLMMLALVIIGGVLGGPLGTLLPAVAREIYGGGEGTYTLFIVFFGAGAVLGASIVAYLTRKAMTPWRAYVLMTILGACLVGLALHPPLMWGLLLVVVAGMMFVGSMIRLNGSMLYSTPDHLQGRISSVQMLAFRSGTPIGSLLAGTAAHALGVPRVLGAMGVGLMVVVPTLAVVGRQRKIRFAGAAE